MFVSKYEFSQEISSLLGGNNQGIEGFCISVIQNVLLSNKIFLLNNSVVYMKIIKQVILDVKELIGVDLILDWE